MSASFRVSFFLHGCVHARTKYKVTCAQTEASAYANLPTVTKKSILTVRILNGLILKIDIYYLDALPQLLYAFMLFYLLNLTGTSLFSLKTPMVKTGLVLRKLTNNIIERRKS